MPAKDASDEYVDVADFYDHVDEYTEREDIPFFVHSAARAGGPVLELGCGTGRVLIPIARSGTEIVGIDFSPSMLAVCEAHLKREPDEVQSSVTLHQADMRHFDLRRKFALAILPFRSFQHLVSVEDQVACLSCIRRHLIPGGEIILDVFNPYLEALVADNIGEEVGGEPEFELPDGRRVARFDRHVSRDLLRQTIDVELIYYVAYPDGRQERFVHSFVMRYMFRFEAEHLLARCGFAVQSIFSDFDNSPYGSEYPGELVIVGKNASSK